MRGAVRVVFEALDPAGDAVLVALEIDQAIVLLVTAPAVPRRDPTVVVAPARAVLSFDQRPVRLAFVQIRIDDLTTRGGRAKSV